METGIALLELAQRLVVLYESQTGPEKRRLLKFVQSNSLWDGEERIHTAAASARTAAAG